METTNHPMISRLHKRLKIEEKLMIHDFIMDFGEMNNEQFEIKINRLFLDQTEKPKHWKEILEVLSCINSRSKQRGIE